MRPRNRGTRDNTIRAVRKEELSTMNRRNRGWKNFLAAAGLCAAVAVGALGMSVPAEAATAAADGVNVRNDPSSEGDNIIGSLSQGDEVTILNSEEADDGYTWYYIQLDNGNTGWVRSDLISADESEIGDASGNDDSDSQETQNADVQAEEDTQTDEGNASETSESSAQDAAVTAATSGGTAVSASAVSSDPTTDPNSSYSTQFLTGDDGVSCWYVVNDATGEKVKISDLQNGTSAAVKRSGSGWRVFAIIMLLIAIALAAFVLFLLKSIRGGRSKSTHGRVARDAEDQDAFADDEDEYYFEDDDDEDKDSSVQSALREDEEEIPDVEDDETAQDEPLYEDASAKTSDGQTGSQKKAKTEEAVEHITDAEEIPAGETPDYTDTPQEQESAVYTEDEDQDSGDYFGDDEEYYDEEETPKKGGFRNFMRRILGGDSKEDREEQYYDEETDEDEPEEFDEFKEYPEDVDLLPRDDTDKSGEADYAEDITFEDDELEENHDSGRTRLSMQRVMKNSSGNGDDDEIPDEDSEYDDDSDNPEDDLFDEDDDDMEYSFLGTRNRNK